MAEQAPPAAAAFPALAFLDEVLWDAQGLAPAIAQERCSGDVLMLAYMNRESLQRTIERGEAVYWSRSRQRLWHKGEESGHIQKVHAVRLDCDGDVLLLQVEQIGHQPSIACHTGRHSCFYKVLNHGVWQTVEPVIKPPSEIYK
jgi:phosphoribosyl-AMP cyclohydrolase